MDQTRAPRPSAWKKLPGPAYLESVTGGKYGAPLSFDAPGYDFDFERVGLTKQLLDHDAPTCRDSGISVLRYYYHDLQRSRASETPPVGGPGPTVLHQFGPTPDKKRSLASTATRNAKVEEIGQDLHIDARHRLDDVYLELMPNTKRDEKLSQSLASPAVNSLFDELSARTTNNSGIILPIADEMVTFPEGKATSTTPTESKLEEDIEASAVACMSAYRKQLYQEAVIDDTGFGSCCSHGKYSIANPEKDDREDHRPDIPIFARQVTGTGKAHVCWADVVSFIEVKLRASDDLSKGLLKQVLRYVRRIKHAHPLCSTVHGATLCGHKLRLYTFGPGTFTTSRAYSLANPADRLPIARIFAFLVAAKPMQLVGQWSPPPRFRIQPAEGAPHQDWTWTDGSPQVVFVRPEVFGSHTVIFGGQAANIGGSNDGAKSGDGWLVFIKCIIIPRYLRGHELRMQRALQHLPRTPLPLGFVDTEDFCRPPSQKAGSTAQEQGAFPLGPFCLGRDEETSLFLHAFAYRHRRGEIIPDSMSERDLCSLGGQLTGELLDYSHADAHYRDLNLGNWIYERTDAGVELILVDHGNVRLAMQRRGDLEQDTQTGESTRRARRLRFFTGIALDDARSVTRMFMPSGADYVELALDALREGERRRQKPAPANPSRGEGSKTAASLGKRSRFVGRSHSDFEMYRRAAEASNIDSDESNAHDEDLPALLLRLYAHTYIDDLESILYMLLVLGAKRSFAFKDERLDALEKLLRTSKLKRYIWESREQWRLTVEKYNPSMSSEWLKMLVELHEAVRSAQTTRRKVLRRVLGDDAETADPHEEETKLSSRGYKCFLSCADIFDEYMDCLRTKEFTQEDLQPEANPGDTSVDPDVLYRTPPLNDWRTRGVIHFADDSPRRNEEGRRSASGTAAAGDDVFGLRQALESIAVAPTSDAKDDVADKAQGP